MYKIQHVTQNKKDFIDPKKWRTYVGRTGQAENNGKEVPGAGGIQTFPGHLFKREWYLDVGNPPLQIANIGSVKKDNWLFFQDPTNGCQSFELGAQNRDLLLTEDD